MRAGRGHKIYPVNTFTIAYVKSLGYFFVPGFFYLIYLYDIK